MKYTKVMPLFLAGMMAVSPLTFGKENEFWKEMKSQTVAEVRVEAENATEDLVLMAEKESTGEVVMGEVALVGMSQILNAYYDSVKEGDDAGIYVDGVKMKAVNRVPSPYDNLAIANVNDYVNIRSGPSTDYDTVGKLYKGCVANVLGYEGGWVKIQSGNLAEGYIRGDYLLIGWVPASTSHPATSSLYVEQDILPQQRSQCSCLLGVCVVGLSSMQAS